MLTLRTHRAVIAMGLLTLSLASCGVPLANQCESLAETMTTGEEFTSEFDAEMKTFVAQFQDLVLGNVTDIPSVTKMATSYVDTVNRFVNKIDQMAVDLVALELPDAMLAEYRDQYATVTNRFGEEFTKMEEAMVPLKSVTNNQEFEIAKTEFVASAQTAFETLNTLSLEAQVITDNIQSHCKASQS